MLSRLPMAHEPFSLARLAEATRADSVVTAVINLLEKATSPHRWSQNM